MGARVIFSCLKELATLREKSVSPSGSPSTSSRSASGVGVDVDNSSSSEVRFEDIYGARTGDDEEEAKDKKEKEIAAQAARRRRELDEGCAEYSEEEAGGTDSSDVLQQPLDATGLKFLDSLIQDVVFLGSPVSVKVSVAILVRSLTSLLTPTPLFVCMYINKIFFQSHHWPNIRKIVNGRLVNGYTSTDLMLRVIYRYNRATATSVAGSAPVDVNGVENIDLSQIVEKV